MFFIHQLGFTMSINANDTQTSYSLTSKILHWVMAVLVMLMFFAFLGFKEANTDAKKIEMLMGHSSIGAMITFLVVIRIYNTFINKAPKPQHNIKRWQLSASSISHKLLYALLIFVPITGMLTARAHELPVLMFGSFNLSNSQSYVAESFASIKSLHVAGIYTLMIVLFAHIGAALLHKFVLKDQVFASMWRSKNK